MEVHDNIYTQSSVTLAMERIAANYGKAKRDLFRPLMMSRRMLTKANPQLVYDEWVQNMQQLRDELHEDDRSIIYIVLAILFYKYEADIDKSGHGIDDMLTAIDLDSTQFYTHFYNDDMRLVAQQSKAIDMLERCNAVLFDLAENTKVKPMTRIQAVKAIMPYIQSCLAPNAPGSINVYGQALIDNSKNKVSKAFNVSELKGQGTTEFKRQLQEIEEIHQIESNSTTD